MLNVGVYFVNTPIEFDNYQLIGFNVWSKVMSTSANLKHFNGT